MKMLDKGLSNSHRFPDGGSNARGWPPGANFQWSEDLQELNYMYGFAIVNHLFSFAYQFVYD